MQGTIDLNSVIAMMNQAENASQRAIANFGGNNSAHGIMVLADQASKAPLHKEVPADSGKGMQEWNAAQDFNKKVSKNMQPVDPSQQVIAMQDLDASQQNYALVAYNVLNSRS